VLILTLKFNLMKKTLLFITTLIFGFSSYSQSVVLGVSPESIAGGYTHTWANPSGGWKTPDFNVAGKHIQGDLVLVDDGSTGNNKYGKPVSQEGCNPLKNNLSGKIAVAYRSTCNFSLKAYNAQKAGAIGIIIINYEPEVIGMAPGVLGDSVKIPTVMLSSVDGEKLVNALNKGPVNVFIGNKLGVFKNDLSFINSGTLAPKLTGVLSQFIGSKNDFGFDIGTSIVNHGDSIQKNVLVTAVIKNPSGKIIYSDSLTLTEIKSSDSVFILPGKTLSFAKFTLSDNTVGKYTLTYNVKLDTVNDDYGFDNNLTYYFTVNDSIYSFSSLDSLSNLPKGSGDLKPASMNNSFSVCQVISNPNASRVGVEGVYFGVSTNNSDSIDVTGEEIGINVYKWTDIFTGIDDPNFAYESIEELSQTFYKFPSDLQDVMVYAKLKNPFVLEDNERYLVCAQTTNNSIYFKYDTRLDYIENMNYYKQPMSAIEIDNVFGIGFSSALGFMPAMAVKVFNKEELSLLESQIISGSIYPNPSKDNFSLSLNYAGNAIVSVIDLSGRTMLSKPVSFSNGEIEMDVLSLNSGSYIVKVVLENGNTTQFNFLKN
jgi:hypothetical protein